jgi:hypothetical protein
MDNRPSTFARAFATYAVVPYLGILFCPGVLLMGGLGVICSYHLPDAIGRRSSYQSIVVGLVVLFIQLFLWCILYRVPGWSTTGGV